MPPAHRTEPPFVPILHLPPLRACVTADASEQIILLKGSSRSSPAFACLRSGTKCGGHGARLKALDWLVIIALVRTGVSPGVRAGTGQEEQRTDSPAVPLR